MQKEERRTFNFPLLDGRIVDLGTKSGANAFLITQSETLFARVQAMSHICAKHRLNSKDRNNISGTNLLFESVSRYGSRDIFQEQVKKSTVEAWLNYVIQQIKQLSTNRNWIDTGKLQTYGTSLLRSCEFMMWHVSPVEFAFESEFFTVLADFVTARKGAGRALPCDDICHSITMVVSFAYNCSRMCFDNTWTAERALKKLEATGVLEQFIRCATIPQPADHAGLFQMLDEFQQSVSVIRKKLQPGRPCGDVVIAILEGRDGSKVERPSVLNKLKTIKRFAEYIDPGQNKMCQNCGVEESSQESSLMKCARCQHVYYCSKECQKANWKFHKTSCLPITKETKKELIRLKNKQNMLQAFYQCHYAHTMVKLVEACEQTGLSKNDVLVELSFMANETGIVPAMQDQPELKIYPTRDFMKGVRFAEQADENYIRRCLASIEVEPNQVLCLVIDEGGYRPATVSTTDPTTKKELFSQEAVNAFKAYMYGGDDGPLSEMTDAENLSNWKQVLGIHYSYGVTDEQKIGDSMDNLHVNEEQNVSL